MRSNIISEFAEPSRLISSELAAVLTKKNVFVGFDGFIDTIVTPVGTRSGGGEEFSPISRMEDFAQRISAAAGKSTNIELFQRLEKIGGNGPIMANALSVLGCDVRYVGALGWPNVNPIFSDFANRVGVVSLCQPAQTTAVEFADGKLMLGQVQALDSINMARINEVMGNAGLTRAIADADLVALVNWTMIPSMTRIFREILESILPSLSKSERRFFFDLADPEKRESTDLADVLKVIAGFEKFGAVSLGLNYKEAQQVAIVLDLGKFCDDEGDLRRMCASIRIALGISWVVIHPRHSAACATDMGTSWVSGSLCEAPKITTGAGDHFNAGFIAGQLMNLTPEACLSLGVRVSGQYVRTAETPSWRALGS